MATYANTGQFDLARKRLNQNATAEQQQQDDALKRRFAAQGGLNSGAYVKQQSLQSDAAMKRKADAMEGIDVAEAQEAQRQREVQEGRDFTRSERMGSQDFANTQRLGSQDFAAGQANLGRQFQTSERLGGQDFSAAQAALQRKYQTGEREAGQIFQSGESKLARDQQQSQFDVSSQLQRDQMSQQDKQYYSGLDFQNRQLEQQTKSQSDALQLERDAYEFNKDMAIKEWDSQNGGMLSDLIGQTAIGKFKNGDILGGIGSIFGFGSN